MSQRTSLPQSWWRQQVYYLTHVLTGGNGSAHSWPIEMPEYLQPRCDPLVDYLKNLFYRLQHTHIDIKLLILVAPQTEQPNVEDLDCTTLNLMLKGSNCFSSSTHKYKQISMYNSGQIFHVIIMFFLKLLRWVDSCFSSVRKFLAVLSSKAFPHFFLEFY